MGQAAPGQLLGIVNEKNQLVEPGDSGEIAGSCRYIMSNYLDNPEATEEATWVHPNGERWLRTGDIGHLDEDGFLYLLDRKKDMIISGGQNIYPIDIEHIILQHPAVADVAVIGASSHKWGETPLAVVVTNTGIELDELREWANQRPGKQQRIAAVVLLGELPRNPNGKVLKRELRTQFQNLKF